MSYKKKKNTTNYCIFYIIPYVRDSPLRTDCFSFSHVAPCEEAPAEAEPVTHLLMEGADNPMQTDEEMLVASGSKA